MELSIIVMYIRNIAMWVVVLSLMVSAAQGADSTLRIDNGTTEISALKELAYQMKHQLEKVTNEKTEIEKRLVTLEKSNVQQSALDKASRTIVQEVIGFTVQLNKDIHDLPIHSTVIYDGVWYNRGSGYDQTTGIFTCPQSGVYLFAIFVESGNTDEAEITLHIDGKYRIAAISERASNDHDSTGGNILVERILKGQRVWVQTSDFDNQDFHRVFSSFSGVLIQTI